MQIVKIYMNITFNLLTNDVINKLNFLIILLFDYLIII
jgi:hypothetical protein